MYDYHILKRNQIDVDLERLFYEYLCVESVLIISEIITLIF